MQHRLLIMLATIVAVSAAQADSTTKPSTQPMQTDKVSTADFDILLPHGWQEVRSESRPGLIAFQSADGNARLTVSVAHDSAPPGPKDVKPDLAKISEIRRQSESKMAPKIRLTPSESTGKDGVWSSSWRGDDSERGRRTATLVQSAKSKLLIFYLEALDSSDGTVQEFAKQVFGSVVAK
jgi:hypothetical protein